MSADRTYSRVVFQEPDACALGPVRVFDGAGNLVRTIPAAALIARAKQSLREAPKVSKPSDMPHVPMVRLFGDRLAPDEGESPEGHGGEKDQREDVESPEAGGAAVNRVECPVCVRSVGLVFHGSGRPRKDGQHTERYIGVHRSEAGSESSEESLCPGSGRWVPRRERALA